MSNEQSAKLPAYRIYSVLRKGDKKAAWKEIGALWPHKDGKGLTPVYTARPLEGAQIVFRVPRTTAQKIEPARKPSRRMLGRYDGLKDAAREVA